MSTVLYQKIQFNISSPILKSVLFQGIQFSISTQTIVFLGAQGTNAYNRYAMCPAGCCRFNPHCRQVTIQEYLTLVPGYD